SIAREQSATLTASPSFAGANELTIDPIPSPAAAQRDEIRPPAAANPARQAPTVQANAPTKPALARSSQPRSASAKAEAADATRLPRRCGDIATAVRVASAIVEIRSCLREIDMTGRSLFVTLYLA